MKRKDIKELKQKTLAELKKLANETEQEQVRLKMETKTGKNKNTRAVARKRDDLARILTAIVEKELEAAS